MKDFKVSTKRPDTNKWWTYGNIKKNKFDNYSLSFRITNELKDLIASKEQDGWINFSLFEDDSPKGSLKERCEEAIGEKLDDEIPF
jgi:hypothetical protein